MPKTTRLRFLVGILQAGAAAGLVPASIVHAAPPKPGHQPSVTVSAPTRLDWVFALANQSPAAAPADWLPADFDSKAQRYELFVPADYRPSAKKTYPLVLFISAGADPSGSSEWRPVAEKLGLIFASPYGVGNDCPMEQRVRIVMDVLDDIRRTYRIDAERTYIGGISGGGRVAVAIGFSLPEYFGGVVPVCASGDLRSEPWLQERVRQRLSAALITGETDFNRGEVERFRGPFLDGVGVRTRVWVAPGMGHSMPGPDVLTEAVQWLESGAADRRKLVKKFPAMGLSGNAPPTREEWSEKLLAEARERLKKRETMHSGLMQLSGTSSRWADLPAGRNALKLLQEYDGRTDRPWEEDDLADQRRFLIARARAVDAYASGPLPDEYAAMRGDMLRAALSLWQQVVADESGSAAGREGQKRIPAIEALLAENP